MYTFCEAWNLKCGIIEKFSYVVSDRNSANMAPWLSTDSWQVSVTCIHSANIPYNTGMRKQKVKPSHYLLQKNESHQLP